MRTTKPISTISFNSSEYLKTILDELTKSKVVSFWTFIKHLPEDDENGKKEHIHLYIEPSKMLQTDDIKEKFKEFDPNNPTKPKGCISFCSSKFADWYLYALHDKRYLASKGQSRKYHYSHTDLCASDDDDLLFKSRSIDLLALSPYADMMDAIDNGISWNEYFSRGTVPIPLLNQFAKAWEWLSSSSTYRNNRPNHPMDIDEDTGEVIQRSDDASIPSDIVFEEISLE